MADPNPNEPSGNGPGAGPVSANGIIGIGIYLLVVATLLFCSLYCSWPRCSVATPSSVPDHRQPEVNSPVEDTKGKGDVVSSGTPAKEAEGKDSADTESKTPLETNNPMPGADSKLDGLRPKVISVAPTSGQVDANTQVTVRGSGFQKGARVTFGGIPGQTVGPVAEDSITAVAPPHHSAKIDVIVINSNGSSDSLLASFQYTCPPIGDAHVLLLVILAGALGGTIHALRSLYWYVGNRELCWSWVPMYIVLPFSGAAIATVFFLIVRGGFLSAAPDGGTSVVIIAIAALTGLFSQQAALKLQDIANAVLAKPAPGGNSKPQAALSVSAAPAPAPAVNKPTIDPNNGGVAGGTEVRILETGFSSVKSLSFAGQDAIDLKFDPATSVITAKSPPHDKGEIDVIVSDNSDPNKTLTLKYRYE
jgi:IPT/TIG domain-containing protein